MLLHDTTISKIAQLIQMAILTGTDIIDHLRMLKLESSGDNYLYVDEEYEKVFNESISKMLNNAQQVIQQESKQSEKLND